MLSESKAHKKAQICVEVACILLCSNLGLMLVKIKINNMKRMGIEDYTLCDNRAEVKPITAMEVVKMMYTEPKVGEQSGHGLHWEKTKPGL